ncbi:Protein of unknown function [Saccharopolyspora kobensis]|uniref:Minor tail T domain-containing protein n=1 Tax=Saccharopolyspora kobensis TaxID=146035 RepID=A0A1H6E163_9PSEU|nr:DUF4035 domain-containing protein [Saccharopolyspora kobensis]SEG90736.1 Protein of unknown function [Saccharopolyspora kobensis]SFD93517.1 Protein of unknown function [Saccharopolyspora kobensis]
MRARPFRRFAHRLAGHLGMTVGELLDRTTSRELAEWQAFERIEGPLGGLRGDVHAAMVCSAIYNANRGKNSRERKPADFLPRWDKPPREPQSPEQMLAAARALQGRLGGELHLADQR